MRYILFILLLINNLSVSAQQRDTVEYLLDYWWKPCAPSKAMYYRMSYREDGLWHVKDYYLKEKTLQMDATALDDSCKKLHGMAFYYYPNGKLSGKARYVNDTLEGLRRNYDSSGKLTDSTLFKKGMPWKFGYKWYSSGKLKYNGIYDDSGKGVGEEWYYYEDGTLSDHGYTTTGHLEDSIWTFYYKSGVISCQDYYNNGKRVKRECYNELGKLENKPCEDTEPDFIESYETFYFKLKKKLRDRVSTRYKFDEGAEVLLKICIDENGYMSKVEMVKGIRPDIDSLIIEVLHNIERFTPARYENRPVVSCDVQEVPLALFE